MCLKMNMADTQSKFNYQEFAYFFSSLKIFFKKERIEGCPSDPRITHSKNAIFVVDHPFVEMINMSENRHGGHANMR